MHISTKYHRPLNALVIAFFLLTSLCSSAQEAQLMPEREMLTRIQVPIFKDVTYTITDYGAIADGHSDCKAALDKAISACSIKGGGEVLVPAGAWFIAGPVVLKSHVNLHFANGSVLIFSSDPKDYLPAVLTLWEGTELYNYSPLFYAYQCSDIALTGKGIVNGSASKEFARWRPQTSPEQTRLRQMGGNGTPVYERIFGEGAHLPPDMIQFFGCKNVLIDGITILDAPYWVIHPVLCNNVTVQHVTIDSHNLNNDGCDPESTTNVLIQDCNFNTGDDGIAIKAGRDQDGWRIGQPTENVIARNDTFRSAANGICIGSEMSAGVRNVIMYNITISKCLSGIYFKSNLDRGGFIENVYVHDIKCDSVKSAFIRFENNYYGSRGGHYTTLFNNFLIQHVHCNYAGETGIYAVGVAGNPLKNIRMDHVQILKTPVAEAISNTEHFSYSAVSVNGKTLSTPTETSLIHLHTY